MLEVDQVTFSYTTEEQILAGVSLSVSEGEILSVIGKSGAGKSTFLKCIAGLLSPSSGSIFHSGKEVVGPDEKLIAGHDEIAWIPQEFKEDDFYTVFENIKRHLLHLSREQQARFTKELIDLLDLTSVKEHKSKDLSGGERQRLSIACALAREPEVLLLDEPFAHLDVHLRKKVGRYLKKLCTTRGMAIILVTHEGEEALSWSDKIAFMNKGKIKRKCTPEDAYNHPKSLYEGRFFGELNSIYVENKQHLFRPWEYKLTRYKNHHPIEVSFLDAEFRSGFYANFFKLSSGKELVLFSNELMRTIKQVYVKK